MRCRVSCRQRRKPAYAGFLADDLRAFTLCALDLSGLHAARANVGLADVAVLVSNRDRLNIGLEPAVRHAMRVADVAASGRLLAADFTNLRHIYQLRFTISPRQMPLIPN